MIKYPYVIWVAIAILATLAATIAISLHLNSSPKFLRSNGTQGSAIIPSQKYAAGSLKGLNTELDVKVLSDSLFSDMIIAAKNHPRKRKMSDLTKDPQRNSLQKLVNVWTNGSYSPIHKHLDYSEVSYFDLPVAQSFLMSNVVWIAFSSRHF